MAPNPPEATDDKNIIQDISWEFKKHPQPMGDRLGASGSPVIGQSTTGIVDSRVRKDNPQPALYRLGVDWRDEGFLEGWNCVMLSFEHSLYLNASKLTYEQLSNHPQPSLIGACYHGCENVTSQAFASYLGI